LLCFVLLFAVSFGQTPYTTPWTISSSGGVLRSYFNVSRGLITWLGRDVVASTWNRTYLPPVLRVKPGDRLEMTFRNYLDQVTNVHFHGLQVTPGEENPFISIAPGTSFTYRIKLPLDHPPGLCWYHSHAHEHDMEINLSQMQVHNGMAGAIIVDGLLDNFPELEDSKEIIFQMKDLQVIPGSPDYVPPDSIDSNDPNARRTVNAVTDLVISIAPGETQVWYLFNLGSDLFYNWTIVGLNVYEFARDARQLMSLETKDVIMIGPGTRVSLFVQAPATAGTYEVRTLQVNNFRPAGDLYPDTQIATLNVTGTAVTPVDLGTLAAGPVVLDLIGLTNKPSRLLHFNQTSDNLPAKLYWIDNKLYDPDRVDISVNVGDIEEWILWNDSSENHWFHLHQIDFQLWKIDGVVQPFNGYADTCPMPRFSNVSILISFNHSHLVGRTLYHCHIMAHEDTGMMGVLEVNPAPSVFVSFNSLVVVFLLFISLLL